MLRAGGHNIFFISFAALVFSLYQAIRIDASGARVIICIITLTQPQDNLDKTFAESCSDSDLINSEKNVVYLFQDQKIRIDYIQRIMELKVDQRYANPRLQSRIFFV